MKTNLKPMLMILASRKDEKESPKEKAKEKKNPKAEAKEVVATKKGPEKKKGLPALFMKKGM